MAEANVREAKVRAERTAQSPWIERLARVGLLAQGVSFGLVAVLAIKVALHEGGQTTDRQGALKTVAQHSFGKVLLVVLAVGFAGYAIWRFVQAFFDRDRKGDDPKGLAKRAGSFGKGTIYAGLFVTTVSILLGSGDRGGGSGKEQHAAAGVLDWPAGRWIVGAVGAAVVGAGLWNGYRAVTRKFKKELKTEEMSPAEERWTTRVGVVGLLARMIVFCIVGWFLIRAAIQYDPKEAIGLDGALAKLAHQSYGSVLLGVVAAGLFAFGLFSVAQARYRRV